jgi:phosphatidylglycerophosphate synthase
MALEDPAFAELSARFRAGNPQLAVAIVPAADGAADPTLNLAGLTIAERQRRQLQRLGAIRIDDLSHGGAARSPVRGELLLIEAGLVADERLIAAFLDAARRRGATAAPLIACDLAGQIGGLVWLPQVSAGQPLPDWSGLAASAERFEFAAIDDYAPERRRRVPLLWERPRDAAAARKVGLQILSAAQKGCLDWPARFVHPPVENFAVRLLWPTPVTPNAISLLTFALGLYAAWCFATGALWTGLLFALLVGPLDGIDGKLARTRVEFSRWGDLEHVGDKIVEYAWFGALAAHFGAGWAWALAALIVFAALSEALQGEFYRRLTGAQLDDAGAFERGWRLVSGRRNTFFWSLLPFGWFGSWDAGLVMIASYALITWFVAQWRFFVRLAEFGRANSPAIAANLDATGYGFGPASDSAERPGAPAASASAQTATG